MGWRNMPASVKRLAAMAVAKIELSVVVTLVPIVGLGWGFVALANEVGAGETHALDNWVLKLFRRKDDLALSIGPRWLAEVARDVTAMGGVVVVTLVTAVVAGHYFLIRRRRAEGLLVLGASLGALLANGALKGWFQRSRPTVVPRLVEVATYSFPSGHAMLSAAVYLTLGLLLARSAKGWWSRAYYIGIAVLLTGAIGASRVFLGVHYPSDVLAGWMAGLVWALLCREVVDWLAPKADVGVPDSDDVAG